jgi:glycyl-tRNA synthetase
VDEDLTKKYRRREVEDLLKRKFFVTPSFEIYGGVSGFYDFGPLGSAVKNNVESLWRQHFVLEEDMLEVGCTCLTYSEVLKTSGHVDKFEDLMVKDAKLGTPKRADKLINEWIAKVLPKKKKQEERAELEKLAIDVDNYNAAQIDECIAKFQIKDPETGNDLTKAEPFNLMFGTMIGPTGQMKGYLRPETA